MSCGTRMHLGTVNGHCSKSPEAFLDLSNIQVKKPQTTRRTSKFQAKSHTGIWRSLKQHWQENAYSTSDREKKKGKNKNKQKKPTKTPERSVGFQAVFFPSRCFSSPAQRTRVGRCCGRGGAIPAERLLHTRPGLYSGGTALPRLGLQTKVGAAAGQSRPG